MGDLKTFYDKPAYADTTDLAGDLATQRGSDPNADGASGPALINFWPDPKQATASEATEESRNSVSGLPPLPTRFAPAASVNDIPDLTDRNPGTIDKK